MAKIIIDNADADDFNELMMLARAKKLHSFYMTDSEADDRPQGEWKEIEGGGYMCQNCENIEVYTPNFCPNCGARMLKGGKDNE